MKIFFRPHILFLTFCFVAGSAWFFFSVAEATSDYRTAIAHRSPFKQVLRRQGYLRPLSEQHIVTQVDGMVMEMAEQGSVVNKGDIILKLDPTPHEDAKAVQEALMAQQTADYKSKHESAAKVLNQAKEDVESYNLLLELENGRLAELKRGPNPIDEVNAEVALENDKNLLAAKQEEVDVIEKLAASGFCSREELRQKQLELVEQRLKVGQSDIALRKLQRLDPVKISEQELKVKDAIKNREAAKDRVVLLQQNMIRDKERFDRQIERETKVLHDLELNIERSTIRAPAPGIVVHKRYRHYNLAPGRNVWDGQEAMSIPDFSKMKAVLTVDEGHIANVRVGQEAEIVPAGWNGPPFKGKVCKVAEKGRDEFELFVDETSSISGTANRQVFDVEIEIEGKSEMLRPGLRTQIAILLKSLDNPVLIPRSALLQEQDDTATVRLASTLGTERRKIKVTAEDDLWAAVEGVKDGERVWVVRD